MEQLLNLIWAELEKLGLSKSGTTLLHFHKWLRTISLLHKPLPLIKEDTRLIGTSVAFSEITHVVQGTYGVLFHAIRNRYESVFLKVCPKYPNALLMEGIFQTIAATLLEYRGFPGAVPRILDIFRHPTAGILLSIEQLPGVIVFSDYLKDTLKWGIPSASNDQIIFSVIGQLAIYLNILEEDIGMNHRDLKSTNVLLVAPNRPITQQITLKDGTFKITCKQQAVLIDFGFACIGQNGGKQIASVGEFLPEIDFCPKKGRDLFLFFASLWNVPALRDSLTKDGQELFRKWLHDSEGVDWASWLIQETKENMKSMYLLTMGSVFQSKTSATCAVLKDIAQKFPTIVTKVS
jgi:serine/threonine protein kinase